MKNFTKHASGQTEAPEDHNLHGFYELLLKVYRRNQKEKRASGEVLNKKQKPQINNENEKKNVV